MHDQSPPELQDQGLGPATEGPLSPRLTDMHVVHREEQEGSGCWTHRELKMIFLFSEPSKDAVERSFAQILNKR